MQKLNVDILNVAKKMRIKKLEEDLQYITNFPPGQLIECPFCHYQSKKNRKGTAKIFKDERGTSFKCFACSVWRRIE